MAHVEDQKMQVMLKALGYKVGTLDGVFGPKTAKAVEAFQADYGLGETGDPDQGTIDTLYDAFLNSAITLHNDLFQMMLYYAGYDPGTVDGVLGKKTEKAVYNFQEDQGLEAHGEWDEDTVNRLKELLYS